ncbi:MAG TPA: flagellar motor switch protein FliN [Acidimicrobiales bacterium]|nr:flagellar motor switch protein FliN [Acidimicrobiales bacterium]
MSETNASNADGAGAPPMGDDGTAAVGMEAGAGPGAGPGPGTVAMRPRETLNSVELPVTVELGRTRLLMKELLSLRPGSVVELDRHVGAPVDVYVNSTLLAHGEVVVVDEELGVRITAIASSDEARGA